jgi:hypothetical protein
MRELFGRSIEGLLWKRITMHGNTELRGRQRHDDDLTSRQLQRRIRMKQGELLSTQKPVARFSSKEMISNF